MKKFWLYILVIVALCSVSACNTGDVEDPNTTEEETGGDDQDIMDEPIQSVRMLCESYNSDNDGDFYPDGNFQYELIYYHNRAKQMTARWRDDLVGSKDKYAFYVETTTFEWGDDFVKAHREDVVTYTPSGKTETDSESDHYAKLSGAHATEGWAVFKDGDYTSRTDWKASYDANGYLMETSSKDDDSSWSTFKYTWGDGNVTKIDWKTGRYVTISYSGHGNSHTIFDINQILPYDMSCYSRSSGDPTLIWSTIGLMGTPSDNLISSITEYDGSHTHTCSMEYSKCTGSEVIVRVTNSVDGVIDNYHNWDILLSIP